LEFNAVAIAAYMVDWPFRVTPERDLKGPYSLTIRIPPEFKGNVCRRTSAIRDLTPPCSVDIGCARRLTRRLCKRWVRADAYLEHEDQHEQASDLDDELHDLLEL